MSRRYDAETQAKGGALVREQVGDYDPGLAADHIGHGASSE
jgi:hypothetical protein